MKPKMSTSFWDVTGRDREILLGCSTSLGKTQEQSHGTFFKHEFPPGFTQMSHLGPGVEQRGGQTFQLPGK